MNESSLKAACEHAAEVLTRFVGAPVAAVFEGARRVEPNMVVAVLGGAEPEIMGVLVEMTGSLRGELFFGFPPASADLLARALTGEGVETEIGESAVKETTNILASSWLSALGRIESLELHPTAPVHARDMTGAIVDEVVTRYVDEDDAVSIVETRFSFKTEMVSAMILVFVKGDRS
jgi:chemotaxis protein CheY-P-specific phosphatase CheC